MSNAFNKIFILAMIFTLLLIIPTSFASDIDSDLAIASNDLSVGNDNLFSVEDNADIMVNDDNSAIDSNLISDDSAMGSNLISNEELFIDSEIVESDSSIKSNQLSDGNTLEYYFDSKVANDRGDGSFENPYKYLTEFAKTSVIATKDKNVLNNAVLDSYSSHRLHSLGSGKDVEFCLKHNISNNVPIYKDGYLKKI